MPPTGPFQKSQHTSVLLGGLAVAAMFGDAARPAAGLGMFVHVRAPTAIPAFHCMVPMALMAAQGIGQLTRPGVGEIGGKEPATLNFTWDPCLVDPRPADCAKSATRTCFRAPVACCHLSTFEMP
jgi:hypothetical protein